MSKLTNGTEGWGCMGKTFWMLSSAHYFGEYGSGLASSGGRVVQGTISNSSREYALVPGLNPAHGKC